MVTLRNVGEKESGGPARGNASTVTELVAAAERDLAVAVPITTQQ